VTKPLFSAALAAALAGVAAAAMAADFSQTALARHEHFKEIGKNMKGLGDELKSGAPSLVRIQGYAKRIDELAPQVTAWFPEGSGPGHGFKTLAKAEIWQRPDEFKRDAAAFVSEADKLNAVAAGGSIPEIGAQARAVGGACKTCHEAFRERDD
jgi:cytochrome c556